MSYVDAFWDKEQDVIRVVERTPKGERKFIEYPAKYVFYHSDPKGKYTSIFGDRVSKVSCSSYKEFQKEQRIHSNKKLYESDINPVFRCLEENYLGQEPPKLHVAFWDIETSFCPERGYASPDEPFMPITAISVYLQWLDTLVCLSIPPKTLTIEQAQDQIKDFENTILFDDERRMLDAFLTLIEDADVLSAWNGEGFDIPYTVNRVKLLFGKDETRRFCLWNQFPKPREYEKYGKVGKTYDLIGRVHMDSLEVYRKFTFEERHSYRLDAIAEYELGERKTVYDGTLEELYNKDFRTFIEYNRQDTALLNKLDRKLKFLALGNGIAHQNTVLLQTTMGAVAVSEQAIINEAHRLGMVVPARKSRTDQGDTQAAGAYVAYPKKGLHDWIGTLDINSLYPSIIRAMNMGPETIVGQLRQTYTQEEISAKIDKGSSFADAWDNKFCSNEYQMVIDKDMNFDITIDWEDGRSDVLCGAQIYELIFEGRQPWMLSANGTIFTYEREGVIPGLLSKWYADRKVQQAKMREALDAGRMVEAEQYDRLQHQTKISLNSIYGSLLNPGCRFFDKRMGQSTTLTGRCIARHMAAQVNSVIANEYDYRGKSIIYGDSVTGDTKILTQDGDITIEELFNRCVEHSIHEGKEYGVWSPDKVIGFNAYEDSTVMANMSYVMRHKTKKKLYLITLENGKSIKVTEDHSIMVDRNGFLQEVKPVDILDTDLIICLKRD